MIVLPAPGVPGSGSVTVPATVDGVCILLHGLSGVSPNIPQLPTDIDGLFPTRMGTWANDLVLDNWVVIYPEQPQDGYIFSPIAGIYADWTSGTSNNGQQLLNTTLSWWDQIVLYCNRNWPGKKIMVGGMSGGGYLTILIGQYRASDIIGGVAHVPATIWENISPLILQNYNFASLTLTNYDLGPHALDACNVPMLISYGTNDSFVGWQNPGGSLPTSNTDAIITNANSAGKSNVVRHQTTDTHEMLAADVTAFMSFINANIDPLR